MKNSLSRNQKLLISLVLVTNGIYWGMLETGQGFPTANSIIVFPVAAINRFSNLFRSLTSRLFSSWSIKEIQREPDTSFQFKRQGFATISSAHVSTSGGSGGFDTEQIPLNGH